MSIGSAAVLSDGDVVSMLKTILDQNSLILSQNADMNARLFEVEKLQQRLHPSRPRPRSKCNDGFLWQCPVCQTTQIKHLDSFVSHIRKLAVHTKRRFALQKETKVRCCLHLDNADHLQLVFKFFGANNDEKAVSFSKHFLFFCRTTSASRIPVKEKHERIMDWLQRAQHDPNFAIPGECPSVSDVATSGSTSAGVIASSGSDAGHVNLRFGRGV